MTSLREAVETLDQRYKYEMVGRDGVSSKSGSFQTDDLQQWVWICFLNKAEALRVWHRGRLVGVIGYDVDGRRRWDVR